MDTRKEDEREGKKTTPFVYFLKIKRCTAHLMDSENSDENNNKI
jgi:hypothetical protein